MEMSMEALIGLIALITRSTPDDSRIMEVFPPAVLVAEVETYA